MYVDYPLDPLADAAYPAATVAYTGTAGAVTAYPPGPQGVWVFCDTAAYVLVGNATSTATATNGTPIPANTPVKFVIPATVTGTWRVSAIQIATGGNLYTKPINVR